MPACKTRLPARPRRLFSPLATALLAAALAVLSAATALAQSGPDQALPPGLSVGLPDLPALVPDAMSPLPAPDKGADMVPDIAPDQALAAADLTPMGMYRAAHPVVKGVMLLLALAAVASWTVLLFKTVEISLARGRARRSCRVLGVAPTLEVAARDLAGARDPAALMACAARDEMRRSAPALDRAGPDGVKERVRSLLLRADAVASARMRRGTGLLATIGAIAPFVGLFGTVWGIMNAFVGIAESRSSNLAVVAPGIAEALLATAIGLVAAIPAVVIYNLFTRRIAAYRLMLGDAAAAVERLVSRDLDFGRAGLRAEV